MQLFGAALVILWLFEKNSEKKKAIDSFIIAVLIYGLIRIISIIFSEYPDESISALYREALFFLSIFPIGFYLKSFDDQKKKIIIYSFIAGAVINSLIGIIQFNLGLVSRAESLSSGYMVFSIYLLSALGIVSSLFLLNKEDKKINWLLVSGNAIILSGIVASLGRANLTIALLILFSSLLLKLIDIKSTTLIIILAAIVSFISFQNNSGEVTQRIESPASLSDRDIIFKGAVELAWEHPVLGFGPRTFKEIFPFREEFADKGISGWHNHIFQVYFESGLIGLAAYLYIFVIIFKTGLRAVKTLNDEKKKIVKGILLSVSALFLASFFSSVIDTPVLSIVFVFIVSIKNSEIYPKQSGV